MRCHCSVTKMKTGNCFIKAILIVLCANRITSYISIFNRKVEERAAPEGDFTPDNITAMEKQSDAVNPRFPKPGTFGIYFFLHSLF